MANTVWSSTDKVSVTLSGGNLKATAAVNSGFCWIRGADKKLASGGKFYWEFLANPDVSGNTIHGFAPSGLSNLVGSSVAGFCGLDLNGFIWMNGSFGFSIGSIANVTVGVALDLNAKLVWFRIAPSGNWNASGTANPATGTGGFNVSAVTGVDACPAAALGQINEAVVANFGDSAFSGAVPSGFTAGWSTNAPPPIELAGNLGGGSYYGKFSYGRGRYSRTAAFAPIFSADLDVHVSLIDLAGGIAPQIALGGSLTGNWLLTVLGGGLTPNVVLGASGFVSGPLWQDSELCSPPSWQDSESCLPPLWTPTIPPDWAPGGAAHALGYGMRAYGVGEYNEFTSPWMPTELCDG